MKSITRIKYFIKIFALLSLIPASQLFPQFNDIISDHLTINDGLSQSTINCITQDRFGFIWFGTQDGLNRYDGYNFKVFKHIIDDSSSVSDNNILALFVDDSGELWIATENGGLNKFNYNTETFTHFVHNPKNLNSISSDHINFISEDHSGNLWIATNGGLDILNKKNFSFKHFKHNDNDPGSLGCDSVLCIYIDHNRNIWIGTNNGLDYFNRNEKTFSHYKHNPQNINSISSNKINSISESKDGSLWIGTADAGLDKLNTKTKKIKHFKHLKNDPNSLSSDSVEVVFSDNDDTIWVGCVNGGLNEFIPQSGKFSHVSSDFNNPNSIDDNQILSIYQDNEGLIWVGSFTSGVYKLDKKKKLFGKVGKSINNPYGLNDNNINAFSEDVSGDLLIGTNNGGLNILNRKTGKFIHITKGKTENSIINNSIISLYVDKYGMIWIGTSGGLDRFNPMTNHFDHFLHDPKNSNSLGYPFVNSIISDSAGSLWFGLWGGGLDKLESSNRFIHFRHDPKNSNSLGNNDITYLYLDKEGIIWIGTNGGGLDSFNPRTNKFFHYRHNPHDKNSLSQNVIYAIYQRPNDYNYLWIGTAGGGLNRLDINSGRFISYMEEDGLPNNQVYGILGDKTGNLWLSTNKGLSRFDPSTKTFKNYDQSYGLQSNEFNQGAFFEDKKGEMFFGGVNGFNMFYPGNIKENDYKPPIVITSIKEFNKGIKLPKPIFLTDTLIFSNKDYVLTFSFAALSYTNPSDNLYAYKLEGFDKDWIDLGKNNNVTFSNLDPGEYVLKIKASNNDGVWNEKGTTIILVIEPPFWLTWWFKILLSVSIIFLIFILYRLRIKNIQSQNKKLEALVEERTNELQIKTKELVKFNKLQAEILDQLSKSESELKELNEAKDKYFSILAHDLRSPFNSLIGFSDLLENEYENLEKDEIKRSAKNINISAKNLLKLINNLLEWSMFQAGKMEFKPDQENLFMIVEEVINIIQGNALQKSIKIKNEIKDDISVWADKFMLHSIFQNLISNSIKFTDRGGAIKIFAKEDLDFVEIIVSDSGIGIKQEDINKIFDIKKSHSTKGTENESGTGLGLNLCKELIRKHGGEISVESEIGVGTKFIFTLPNHRINN